MLNTKLIIISGISGTGKSTTAKNLSYFLKMNKIKVEYLHEECIDHPIRSDEFNYGDITNIDDMDKNVEMMLNKWNSFKNIILQSEKIFLIEACLYENITRYFFECNYPDEKISSFYSRLMSLLSELNPVIIHLRTSDVRKTFEKIYPIRGDWWKDLILNDKCLYRLENHYDGDEGVYQMTEDYQNFAIKAFDNYDGMKLAIYTNEQKWTEYHKQICDFFDIIYYNPYDKIPENIEIYCGRYEFYVDNEKYGITIFTENNKLFCKSFWPYMELIYKGDNKFSFMSFPIELDFRFKDNKVYSVYVGGNYDWDATDRELLKTT